MSVPLLLLAKGFTAVALPPVALPPQSPTIERTVAPGEVMLEQDVRLPQAARVEAPVALDMAGERIDVTPDTVLEAVTLGGPPTEALGPMRAAYCVRPKVDIGKTSAKAVASVIAFGVFGGMMRTGMDPRMCLIDRDADGRFDTAVHLGAKRKADLRPTSVPPTPYRLEENVPTADGVADQVRVLYEGPKGSSERGLLRVQVRLADEWKNASWLKRRVEARSLPATISIIGGAQLMITALDPTTGVAQVRIDRPFTAPPPLADPNVRVPIYIYVPH